MYNLSVVTPEKIVFEGQVASVIAPGTVGYLEILSGHAPLITSLMPGKLTVTVASSERLIHALSGGFLEISQNAATLLADSLELTSEIDLDRAEKSRERALKRLESKLEGTDLARAKSALARAENRIRIYRETKASVSQLA